MNKYDVIINKLKKAKTVAVFLHINPDCDCIGSAIALSKFLRKDGKNVDYFSPDLASISMISDKYLFLPGIEEFNKILTFDSLIHTLNEKFCESIKEF